MTTNDTSLAAALALLSHGLDDPSIDVGHGLAQFAAAVRAAVPSYCGLSVTVVTDSVPVTITAPGLTTDANDVVLVQSAVDLGHNLGLHVVAEGVEDAATRSMLGAMGCDELEGYLVSRPVPADRFASWLKQQPHQARTVDRAPFISGRNTLRAKTIRNTRTLNQARGGPEINHITATRLGPQ